MKSSALALAALALFGIALSIPAPGAPVAIANHSFEADVNPSGVGAFASGDLEDLGPSFLSGWSIIATDNNAAQNNQEVAVGWKNIAPGEGVQVLSLMAGAAIAQETNTLWSSLSAGDTLTLTIAVGDRSNTGSEGQPFFTDQSYFGLSDGLASRGGEPNDGAGGPLDPNWITGVVARTSEIVAPPTGYKSGTMGDIVLTHTVTAGDVQRGGRVGVFIASIGKRDAAGLGRSQNYNQGFFDNVRLDITGGSQPAVLGLAVDSLTGTTLKLTVTRIPAGQTFYLRQSSDLQTFVPLTPSIEFDDTTPQPFEITITDPSLFLQVFGGAAP